MTQKPSLDPKRKMKSLFSSQNPQMIKVFCHFYIFYIFCDFLFTTNLPFLGPFKMSGLLWCFSLPIRHTCSQAPGDARCLQESGLAQPEAICFSLPSPSLLALS